MAKDAAPSKYWKRGPEAHDYPAAAAYLSLLFPKAVVDGVITSLRAAGDGEYAAKHLLHAARLPVLPRDDVEVKKALKRIETGRKLSPVLLVRGDASAGVPLTVADGYARICACYHLSEDTRVLGRIADRPSISKGRPSEAASTTADAAIPTVRAPLVTAGRLVGTLIAGLLLLCLVEVGRVIHRRRPTTSRRRLRR